MQNTELEDVHEMYAGPESLCTLAAGDEIQKCGRCSWQLPGMILQMYSRENDKAKEGGEGEQGRRGSGRKDEGEEQGEGKSEWERGERGGRTQT